jgi:hypothetical protein
MLNPVSAFLLSAALGFAIVVPFGGLKHRTQPVGHQTEAGCGVLDPEAPDYLASVECDIMGCKVKRAR